MLSSDDPVRVFQDFATIDQLSGGRAEIMVGRGSFIESYPLFGHSLQDYDELFSEKLDLLLQINQSEVISWRGKHRPSFDNRGIYPRPFQDSLPVYIADNSQQAADELYPSYATMMNRIGQERGWSPLSRQQFEYSRSAKGALLVGSPQEVIDKILFEHELFGHTRFLAQMSMGDMPHKNILKSIELYGLVVAPAVRKALGK